MIIGIPKEIKIGENRVGATHSGVEALVKAGHHVIVERGAGEGSGFSDDGYVNAGAKLVSSSADAWKAEMILKIKEPIREELNFFREKTILFTYLHLANPALESLTRELMKGKVTAIGYETVELEDGFLPLLQPMSEVAGKMALHIAAHYLEKTQGGRGILVGSVKGVTPSNVVVIGAGAVGWNATSTALGMGANVTVLNRSVKKLQHLTTTLRTAHMSNLTTTVLNPKNLAEAIKKADVVISGVYVTGARAPILVTRKMVRSMRQGSVIVDVSIDQGGIFETSRPTTHKDPVYVEEGVIHYCVTNMPGAVPRTSTIALTNATLPYALNLANLGFKEAVKGDSALAKGVNVHSGCVTNRAVAELYGLQYKPIEEFY
jgi:alanine dehydrogenase